MTTKKIPSYVIENGVCRFADGVEYRLSSRRGDIYVPHPTQISPEEMYVALTGAGLPATTPADLAEIPKKVDLGTFDMRKG